MCRRLGNIQKIATAELSRPVQTVCYIATRARCYLAGNPPVRSTNSVAARPHHCLLTRDLSDLGDKWMLLALGLDEAAVAVRAQSILFNASNWDR
jgi:hypothetical protein